MAQEVFSSLAATSVAGTGNDLDGEREGIGLGQPCPGWPLMVMVPDGKFLTATGQKMLLTSGCDPWIPQETVLFPVAKTEARN